MSFDAILQNWALWAAAAPAAAATVLVIMALRRHSASGRLNAVLKDHRRATADVRKAKRAVSKAQAKVSKLERNANKVKPRVLEEAKELLGDARALEKIAADKALVTANHVRRVIHEEFPPSRQEKLRNRYLPGDGADGRPFSFDS